METKRSSTFNWILVSVLVLLYLVSLTMFISANIRAGDSAWWQILLSSLILSIPLILLYGLIGVLIVAARQRGLGQIDPRLSKVIYWSPRVAGILIILFVSLFALDVFEEGRPLGEMLLAFLMHMLPSLIMALLLAIAWRWEWVGFAGFLLASLFFMRTLFMSFNQPGAVSSAFGMFLLFAGPLLLIALLFGANWRWHSQLHPSAGV